MKEHLPPNLSDKLGGILRLYIKTPGHEILKATTEALFDHNIETDAENVKELLKIVG